MAIHRRKSKSRDIKRAHHGETAGLPPEPQSPITDEAPVADMGEDETSDGQAGSPESAATETMQHEGPGEHIGRWGLFRRWLQTRKGRVTAVIFVALVIAAAGIGATDFRYTVLGLVMRQQIDIAVKDSITHAPVPDAKVDIAGISGITNTSGTVHLKGVRVGNSVLTISKPGYRQYSQTTLVGIIHPQISPVMLVSTGIVLSFNVTDKLSGLPLGNVVARAGTIRGASQDGKLHLVLLPNVDPDVTVALSADGYLDAKVPANLTATQSYNIGLVPAGSVFFLSNRTGHIDLYTSNLDGSNIQDVLPGTGKEDTATGVLPSITHPDLVALVSARAGNKDAYGNPQHDLYIFNSTTKALTKLDENTGFGNYRAWLGDYLVYQVPDTNGCYTIKAYSVASGHAGVVVPGNGGVCPTINASYDSTIFYSIARSGSAATDGLYAIEATGSKQQRLSSTPGESVSRSVENTILFNYYNSNVLPPNIWQSVNLDTLAVTKVSSGPSISGNRAYVESPGAKFDVFIETRDGQSNLYVTDTSGNNERNLTPDGKANQFVQWIGDRYIVFSDQNSALQVVSIAGGKPQKVTNAYSGNLAVYGGGYNPNY